MSLEFLASSVPPGQLTLFFWCRSSGECFGSSDTLTVNRYSGLVSLVDVETDGTDGVEGLDGARGIAVSPDGTGVYVAGYSDDSVAVFARDPQEEDLTFVEALRDGVNGIDGLDGAFDVAVTADGNHVYATGYLEHAVAAFSRSQTTAELTFVEAEIGSGFYSLHSPTHIAIAADGRNVYVLDELHDAIVTFVRDSLTGELTYLERDVNGIGGVEWMMSPADLMASADGENVYVVAKNGDSSAAPHLVVFDRDLETGRLTFVGATGTQEELTQANSVAASHDGASLYVPGGNNTTARGTLTLLARDPDTGTLAFVESLQQFTSGAVGLWGATSAAMLPDDRILVTAGAGPSGGSVEVFARDTASGSLTPIDVALADQGGIPELEGVHFVTASPDGKSMLAAAGDRVVVLRLFMFRDGFEAGNVSGWTASAP